MTAAEQPRFALRMPSLDGIRAFAVALVIVAHVEAAGHGIPAIWRFDLGNLGVRIFFILSGLLITTLLVHELDHTNDISLKGFYFRRALRIFPAFYCMLAVMIVLWQLGFVELNWASIGLTAAYLSNFFIGRDFRIAAPIGHTWSLAVEEQFYLLWPAALRALRPARAVPVLLTVLVVAPAIRVALDRTGHVELARYGFPTVMDALATGALLALLRPRLLAWQPLGRLMTTGRGGLLLLALPLGAWAGMPLVVRDTVGILALNLAIALAILWTLEYRRGPVFATLNSPLTAYLGRASYSIYLWQSPVLTQGRAIPLWLGLPLIGLAALGSYHLVEQPFLRLRSRWPGIEPKRVPDEPALAPSPVA